MAGNMIESMLEHSLRFDSLLNAQAGSLAQRNVFTVRSGSIDGNDSLIIHAHSYR